MTVANWITILAVLLTAALTIGGWVITHLLTRLRTLEELVSTQRDTIDDLKDQRNRLQITAEIQDRFFSVVPKILPPDGAKP